MSDAFGNLRGIVTKIDDDGINIDIELVAEHGGTCYAYDDCRNMESLKVGMKMELEEASVLFENGRVLYQVDPDLRGVSINDVPLEEFLQRFLKK